MIKCFGDDTVRFAAHHTSISSFRLIKDPTARAFEQQRCDDGHKNKQKPRNGTAVAHFIIGKRITVYIYCDEQGFVHRHALGNNIALGKRHKSLNELHDNVEEHHRSKHWERDAEKAAHPGRPIDVSRLV